MCHTQRISQVCSTLASGTLWLELKRKIQWCNYLCYDMRTCQWNVQAKHKNHNAPFRNTALYKGALCTKLTRIYLETCRYKEWLSLFVWCYALGPTRRYDQFVFSVLFFFPFSIFLQRTFSPGDTFLVWDSRNFLVGDVLSYRRYSGQ